jgi:nucleoside-diphosphate-sugar epimerase
MPTLLCIGLGYCARSYVAEFGTRFDRVVATTRSEERAAALGRESLGDRSVEMLLFDATSRQLTAAIALADALLISAAPAEGRDPVLAAFADEIAEAPRLRSVVYLSTLGVYGDSGGAWIDETTPVIPAHARRGHARIDAELAWQALGARRKLWPGTERNGQASARHGPSYRQAGPCIEPRPRPRHRAGDRGGFRAAGGRCVQCGRR